jgi:DNA (cytosine-5)-methyltransferase 1
VPARVAKVNYSLTVPRRTPQPIAAIDLFCGVGGLSWGLKEAKIQIAAGIDIDDSCRYPYEQNIHVTFHKRDIRDVTSDDLDRMWPPGVVRVLAGCAPCQPFSPYRRGADTSTEAQWSLLNEFGRLVRETRPDVVTMENVPRIGTKPIFRAFVGTLERCGYHVDFRSCYCPAYGVPQHRRRLVLLASLRGHIAVPEGLLRPGEFRTVRDEIGSLPRLRHGREDPNDRLHKARTLTDANFKRIKASRPGGTWEDWDPELRAPCHQKASGSTFRNVYARMTWDEPSPTITTLAHNFGTGRFGHPEQHRAISLREAAILQSFPHDYEFVAPDQPVQFAPLGRLIGNAVPPRLAKAVGEAIVYHVRERTG